MSASGVGAASGSGAGTGSSAADGVEAQRSRARRIDVAVTCLALRALWAFDFRGVPLLAFVRDSVLGYMDDEEASVRREALEACYRVLVRPADDEEGVFGPVRREAARKGAAFGASGVVPPEDAMAAAVGGTSVWWRWAEEEDRKLEVQATLLRL